MDIVELVRSKIPKINIGSPPAVCISGGIDSSIILYHVINDLMGGIASPVHTFTATFGNDKDEREKAKRVANYFGTHHFEIDINRQKMISIYNFALKFYPFPRFNLWPWAVIEIIKQMGLQYVFIGEGGDEIFGYSDRDFLEGWAGQLIYVWPAWKEACDEYDVRLHAPFKEIQDGSFPIIDFYFPPNKEILREAYKELLPEFIIKQLATPPSHGFYEMMGMTKEELQIAVTHTWLRDRG